MKEDGRVRIRLKDRDHLILFSRLDVDSQEFVRRRSARDPSRERTEGESNDTLDGDSVGEAAFAKLRESPHDVSPERAAEQLEGVYNLWSHLTNTFNGSDENQVATSGTVHDSASGAVPGDPNTYPYLTTDDERTAPLTSDVQEPTVADAETVVGHDKLTPPSAPIVQDPSVASQTLEGNSASSGDKTPSDASSVSEPSPAVVDTDFESQSYDDDNDAAFSYVCPFCEHAFSDDSSPDICPKCLHTNEEMDDKWNEIGQSIRSKAATNRAIRRLIVTTLLAAAGAGIRGWWMRS